VQFAEMPDWSQFYNPSVAHWWGKCHAWAYSALDQVLNEQVEVKGPEGMRGLWIGGSWISRADLATWLMSVLDQISDKDEKAGVWHPNAMQMLLGVGEYMLEPKGGGVVGDVHRDDWEGSQEVWNQPFVAGSVEVVPTSGSSDFGALTPTVESAIVDRARREGQAAVSARLVHLEGKYGQEMGDEYEGEPYIVDRDWNMYVAFDANGKAVRAYWPKDLSGISGLPTTTTEAPLDWLWKPTHKALKAIKEGRASSVVDTDKLRDEARFFIDTVLAKGVSAETRKAFETALEAGEQPGKLAFDARFKNVGYAYDAKQWSEMWRTLGVANPPALDAFRQD
jgi:hypothetical protein